MPLSRALLAVLAVVLAGPMARGSTSIPNGPALAARRAEWQQCTSFAPDEDTLVPPYSLSLLTPGLVDPRKEGSFARHTLLNRLPAVVNRLIADGRVDEGTASRLRALADEVPDTIPLPVPPAIFATDGGGLGVDGTFCERFNSEWERWTHERKEAKDWAHAMPLISLEIYFHRRVLDCTGYFGGGGESVTGGGNGCGVLQDPFQEMKSEALDAALSSDVWLHTLKDHMEQMQRVSEDARLIEFWSGDDARRAAFLSALGSSSVPAFFDNISQTLTSALKASLWGNRGDLALAPEQADLHHRPPANPSLHPHLLSPLPPSSTLTLTHMRTHNRTHLQTVNWVFVASRQITRRKLPRSRTRLMRGVRGAAGRGNGTRICW